MRIVEEEPERLAEIKGISERKAREIAQQVYEKRDMRKAMIFLQQFGITTALAVKIFEKYGQRMYEVLQNNPYQLADDIHGVGFRIADEIARKAGVSADSEYRDIFTCLKSWYKAGRRSCLVLGLRISNSI